jgi:integrase
MALAVLRRIFTWQAARDDDFRNPIIRGMSRTKPKARARARVLTDDELRAVWKTANETEGPFPAFVKFLLLTCARRTEASAMRRVELDSAGDWTLPASRNKTKTDLVRPLSKAVQAVLAALPCFADCPFVFTNDGRRALRGFSTAKLAFDKACGVTGWRLHDLRRTGRSLLSRAGVPSAHAEQCLGHVIRGSEGIYDRHGLPRREEAGVRGAGRADRAHRQPAA